MVVVWTDVDMTYPNDQIPELVDTLDGYDQVVGARTSEEGTVKFFRVPAKWFIRKLAGYLVQRPIPDLNSGFRAIRRDVADPVPVPAAGRVLLRDDDHHGLPVQRLLGASTPIDYHKRAGSSKFHWRRDTRRYLAQVIRLVLSYDPLRVFMPIGMVLIVIGMAKLGFDIADK